MRGRKRQVPVNTDWTDGDLFLQETITSCHIAPGSRQRAMPCVWCQEPLGAEKVVLIGLISAAICQDGGRHLNGAGFFRHERCQPDSRAGLLQAALAALTCVQL